MSPSDGFTIWLTGLSGAGKTTLAGRVGEILRERGHRTEILDGDQLRRAISPDLGFSQEARDAHVRRVAFIANLLARNGIVALVAVISPYRKTRSEVRRLHQSPFVEVHVDCPLEILAKRDPKGLYARAERGEILGFTGVTAPYEPPLDPEICLRTDLERPEDSALRVIQELETRNLISGPVCSATRVT